MNRALIFAAIGLAAILAFILFVETSESPTLNPEQKTPATEITPEVKATSSVNQIGSSVEGRPIMSYTFGTGSTTLLFVGGIHGGYEWNSSLVAYAFIDELTTQAFTVPETLTITVIPNLNPDGLFAATGLGGQFTAADVPQNDAHETGRGRFNANGIDLNRNFDCKWQLTSTWRGKVVTAGTAAFSEPEAAALRDLILATDPSAVIFWHSQGNAVYGSACEEGILADTTEILNRYAAAADYAAIPLFDAYPITGDAEGWLASIGIPAITVELESRTSAEWQRNRAGITALTTWYAGK
jgi:Zinc carboxypeptidase